MHLRPVTIVVGDQGQREPGDVARKRIDTESESTIRFAPIFQLKYERTMQCIVDILKSEVVG